MCPYKHIIFVKHEGDDKMLIVNLYVYDLIFKGNDERVFATFNQYMYKLFDISDLGR